MKFRNLISLTTVWVGTQRCNGFGQIGQDLLGKKSSNAEEVLFGNSVKMSGLENNRLRLLVGSPMHDYTTPSAPISNTSSVIQDNTGGVFLYELKADSDSPLTWDNVWFLSGDHTNEKIGERISISSDGKFVAVRRHSDASYVQVFNVTDADRAHLVGDQSQLACMSGSRGNTVSLSPDGKRIALSCEYTSGNTGRVEVFEFNGGFWSLIGSLDGYARGNFFGWRTSFSDDGNRLAVSEPNYDRGEESRVGTVRVFDYAGENWVQVGDDIMGVSADDQFGFAMDLSGDGSTLVASSPGGDASTGQNAGTVRVFQIKEGEWSQQGQALEGGDVNHRFGRDVSISSDGMRVAASSYIHDNSRGHVRVFTFSELTWIQHGDDIEGENPKDRFGGGLESVDLAGADGSLLVSGSTYFGEGGRVRVFDLDESMISETESPVISSPHVPSSSPTGVKRAENEWKIDLQTISVRFDAKTADKKIELLYNASTWNTFIQVFQQDCLTPVDDSVVAVDKAVVPVSEESSFNTLAVQLDVMPRQLNESPVYTRLNTETGTISVCVRVELLDDHLEPAGFIQRKLVVDLDLARDFGLQNLPVASDESTVHIDASLEYHVHACQCDARSLECIMGMLPVDEQSEVLLCLTSKDDDALEISEIHEMDYKQGNVTHAAITEGETDDFTRIAVVGTTTVVQGRVLSKFFAGNISHVEVSGTCILSFKDTEVGNRRRLLVPFSNGRSLRGVDREFSVELNLDNEPAHSSVAIALVSTCVTLSWLGILFL